MTPEKFNAWRVVPRLLVALYGLVLYLTVDWFTMLDNPTNAQAAFVSTVVGAGAAWFKFYVTSGSSSNEH